MTCMIGSTWLLLNSRGVVIYFILGLNTLNSVSEVLYVACLRCQVADERTNDRTTSGPLAWLNRPLHRPLFAVDDRHHRFPVGDGREAGNFVRRSARARAKQQRRRSNGLATRSPTHSEDAGMKSRRH